MKSIEPFDGPELVGILEAEARADSIALFLWSALAVSGLALLVGFWVFSGELALFAFLNFPEQWQGVIFGCVIAFSGALALTVGGWRASAAQCRMKERDAALTVRGNSNGK